MDAATLPCLAPPVLLTQTAYRYSLWQNGDNELNMREFRSLIENLDREKRRQGSKGGKHSAHWHAGLAVLQAVDFEKSNMGHAAAK